MMNRVTCPNCYSEVEAYTLGFGTDEDGDHGHGCDICLNITRNTAPADRAAVIRAASHVLGVAFATGRVTVPGVDFAGELGALAEEIADRAVSEGVSAGQDA